MESHDKMTMSQEAALERSISCEQRINGNPTSRTGVQQVTEFRTRGRPTKFTPDRIRQITNLVERGKSREEIAEIIGVTSGTLQVTCSKLGISLRRPKFDSGTGLLPLRQSRFQTAAPTIRAASQRESIMTEPAKACQPVPHAKPIEAFSLAPSQREVRQERANGGASAVFSIRMKYRGEERSTDLPLDVEMIRQLAIEAEFRGMRLGELVAKLILGITRKDLFELALASAPERGAEIDKVTPLVPG
jgi:hypothetical protein